MSKENETAGSLPGIFIPSHAAENKPSDVVQVVTLARRPTGESCVVYRDENYNVWVESTRMFKLKYVPYEEDLRVGA